ncbi:hypothetical protein KIN20_030532 [Parelaphostrongylus tenuis]|uniref:SCP domain-containing protein n=1 Tax=Parelaphostrongylus tenuis TaxID=148309 RepID=A0AAD5R4B4_PARTN|nr:hypothetical protein KIN20_030532 [Parelaphostrongylus tenuis]
MSKCACQEYRYRALEFLRETVEHGNRSDTSRQHYAKDNDSQKFPILQLMEFTVIHSEVFRYSEINCPEQNVDLFHEITRAIIFHEHNYLRTVLASGTQQNGRTSVRFPTATNMSLLKYDCGLEEIAKNISKLCRKDSNHNFNFVRQQQCYFRSTEDLYRLGPFPLRLRQCEKNFQMANAATTRVGCGYTICGSSNQRFLSFVCQYGEPHINVDVPIYKSGIPCSDCHKCIFGLCDNEVD